MENIKEFFEQRTSVRRYEREPIAQDKLDVIYAAIRNTPTSYNGQQFTVIDITDQELKEQLYNEVRERYAALEKTPIVDRSEMFTMVYYGK